MKVLPFPCMRPDPEHVLEITASLLEHADSAAIEDADDILIEDRNRSFYIYELSWHGGTQTGVVGICSVSEFDAGTIRQGELVSADEERSDAERIRATGAQTGPVVLSYRDQPVLDFILAAAKGGAPLYDFSDEDGVRHRVWEVVRTESVEAINAMFATIPSAYVVGGHARFAGAVRVAHEMRTAAEEAGSYTGKEPFNYVLAALFPAGQLKMTLTDASPARIPGKEAEADDGELDPQASVNCIDRLMAAADAGTPLPPNSTKLDPAMRSGMFFHRIAKSGL